MKFSDIQRVSHANYHITMEWKYIRIWMEEQAELFDNDLDPPYQRGYVWDDFQKVAYVEYILKGGMSGRDIFWNCPGWQQTHPRGIEGPLELVDGKQRVSAVLDFLDNKVKAFGHYYDEFEGELRITQARFEWHMNELETREEVIQWYLDMNTGGSIHTEKDLEPARRMLAELRKEK